MKEQVRSVLYGRYDQAVADMKEAQGSLIFTLMDAFEDPVLAVYRIQRAYKIHGKAGLLSRLEKHPGDLGKVKATFLKNLIPNPLNLNRYNEAKASLEQIVSEVEKVLAAEEKVLKLEVALHPSQGASREVKGLEL